MLGWKAQYGYCNATTAEKISKLSQVVFTDVEGFFTIPNTELNLPAGFQYANAGDQISTSSTKKQTFNSPGELAIGLISLLGDDYFRVYFRPDSSVKAQSNQPYFSFIETVWASGILSCPKLFTYMRTRDTVCTYCYVPSLKKLFGGYGEVFNVADDGKLTRLCQFVNAPMSGYVTYYGNGLSYGFMNIVIAPGATANQQSIIEKGQLLQSIVSDSINHEYCINKQGTPGLNTFLTLLLSDFVAPDIDTPQNPYEPGGESGPGDLAPGSFDDTSDPIPLPSLPSISAANTGFTRIYNPTLSQVQELAKYLWTDDTVIETIWNHIKQYFEDPMQAIIGFNLVPVPVPDGGTQNFALMYIDTGVPMTVAANQFVDVDCGSVNLTRYYGSALDQSPYTKVHCFLPYIGMVQLNTDEVMGTTLSINYRVDIVSGSCVASVLVDGNVIYQYSGHCAITIPFSSADFSSYVNAAIQVAKMVGVGVANGIGAALESSSLLTGEQRTGNTITKTTQTKTTERNPSTGRQVTTGTSTTIQTIDRPDVDGGTRASYAGLTPSNIANTVGQVISSKPAIQHSGSFSGNSGYLGVRRPYLIIERPNMCLPANYQSLNGYPSMITMSLGKCKGFTRVQQVQLTGMYATNPEQAEIMELLKMGVVF